LLLLMLASATLRGQDPNFSHFMMSPIYYNPAACGMDDELELRLSYRNLWYGVRPMFHAAKFSGSIHQNGLGGLGLLAISNVEGDGFLKTTNIGFCFAKKFEIIPHHLGLHFGLTSGFIQKSVDWSKLHFDDEFDKIMGQVYPTGFTPPDFNSVIFPDFSFGTVISTGFGKGYNNHTLYYQEFGVAFHHLTQPDQSLTGIGSHLPLKLVIQYQGNYKGAERKDIYLKPACMYELQGGMRTLMYGANMMFNPIYLGLWVRNRNVMDSRAYDAISVCAGFITESFNYSRLTISYNYDFTISRLAPGTLGSHEINLMFEFFEVELFKPRSKGRSLFGRYYPVECPSPKFR
jgi:type IX secretion system PorP/SprF family membrane protein